MAQDQHFSQTLCLRMRPPTTDEWEIMSEATGYSGQASCNTGFTRGTRDFAGRFSQHASQRMLERSLDEHLICHTVARGQRKALEGGRFLFQKDGVSVVSSSASPTMDIITTWFQTGWVQEGACKRVQVEYEQLLEELDSAIDSEGRLDVLQRRLGGPSGSESLRIFHGVDLLENPPECPFLQRCALQGHAECVERLLCRGFMPGVKISAKKRCTILHFAAWGGHSQILEALSASPEVAQNLPYLLKTRNQFGEMPEDTAFMRYLGESIWASAETGAASTVCSEMVDAQRFSAFAESCVRKRVGDPSLTLDAFVEEANLACKLQSSLSPRISIAPGTSPDLLVHHLTTLSHIGCHEFHMSHVALDAVALGRIMDTLAPNFNLQTLTVQQCGLGTSGIGHVSRFLSVHVGQLLVLDLSENLLGDDGVRALVGPSSAQLQSLLLGSVGMTCSGLAALAQGLQCELPGARLAKLRLNHNDLSDPGPAVDSFGAFALLVADPRSSLRYVDIRSTRLLPEQVRTLVSSLKTSTLEAVELHKVSFPEEVARQGADNLLLRALSAQTCSVKKVSLSDLEYPELARAIKAAIKSRVRSTGAGLELTIPEGVAWSGEPLASHRIELRAPTPVRVVQVEEGLPGQPVSLQLRTKWGALENVLDGGGGHLDCTAVGRAFAMRFRLDKDHGAKLRIMEKSEQSNAGNDFLLSSHVVFCHEELGKVLLLRKNNTIAGARLLARLQKYVFPQHLDEEAWSSQTIKKRHTTRCSFEELMHGIDVGGFSDDEVAALSNFREPEHFYSFQGSLEVGRSKSVLEKGMPLFDALATNPVLEALMQCFAEEKSRRSREHLCVPHGHYELPGSTVSAKPSFAKAEEFWTFGEMREETVEGVLSSHFVGPVEIRGAGQVEAGDSDAGKEFVDVWDTHARWYQRIYLCMVPKEMLDPLSGHPYGLQLKKHHCRYPPEWVEVSEAVLAEKLLVGGTGIESLPREVARLVHRAKHGGGTLKLQRRTMQPGPKRAAPQAPAGLRATPVQCGSCVEPPALEPHGIAGAAAATPLVQPSQRPRLQLKPRTKPLGAVNQEFLRDPKIFGAQRSLD